MDGGLPGRFRALLHRRARGKNHAAGGGRPLADQQACHLAVDLLELRADRRRAPAAVWAGAAEIARSTTPRHAARASTDLLSLARLRLLQGAPAMGPDFLALLPDDEKDQEGSGGEGLFRRGDTDGGPAP